MSEEQLDLAAGFGQPSKAEWVALVEKVLKGADFEKRLVSRTHDGVAIQPLYTSEDEAGPDPGFPGFDPRLRGTAAAAGVVGGWDIRQLHAHPDPAVANRQIKEDLERGVSSVVVRLDTSLAAGADGPDGVMAYRREDFEALFDGLLKPGTPIMLDAGARSVPAAELVMELVAAQGGDAASFAFVFGADPIGAVATGHMSPEDALEPALELARRTAVELPKATSLRADGEVYHAAGASAGQEIAAAVASGVQYLRGLCEHGLTPDDAASQIVFTLAADADIFLTIAKFRAARRLWSLVLRNSGAENAGMVIHALTATRMMTARDPWVNILRTTAAAFAAGVAGADSVTVLPFDHVLGWPDSLSRRLARNIQLILIEESNLHRVIDPAGGSFYLERLSDELAHKAWPMVQAIEGEGGMVSALRQGMVQDAIGETFMARLKNIATRREPITGISEFPHLAEKPRRTAEVDIEHLKARAGDALAQVPDVEAIASPLRPMRYAAGFERLLDISDHELERKGARPRIFLCNLGRLAQHNVRTGFAWNAFEAGGIEPISSPSLAGAEPEAAAKAFAESGCRVACLCSSDDIYAEKAAAVVKALKAAGAEAVVLAGRPSPDLEAAGVDKFVYLGCNLLSLLEDLQSLLLGETA